MKYLTLVMCVAICGCDESSAVDQCMRREMFEQCLQQSPGAVKECGDNAYYSSIRKIASIKPECRP